jgi:hypothetical protein
VKWVRRDPAGTSLHQRDEWRMPSYQAAGVQTAVDVQGIGTEAPDYTKLQQQPSYYSQSYGDIEVRVNHRSNLASTNITTTTAPPTVVSTPRN